MTAAARCGLPGDVTALTAPGQPNRPLLARQVDVVYPGQRGGTGWIASLYAGGAFSWAGSSPGWLPGADVDQPFTAQHTSVGRVEAWVKPVGSGADLQVLLCADSSGVPDVSAPLASVVIPASHITALAAAGSLQSAGPLATAASNTVYTGPWTTVPWTPSAATANGVASYSTPVTSGNWTVFLGGEDSTGLVASAAVSAVKYAGNGVVDGPASMPSLPRAAWYMCAAATTDSIIAAGGTDQSSSHFANVWSAPWSSASGSLGAWTEQTSLPAPVVNAGMATWGTYVYVAGGSPDGTNANATSNVWRSNATGGQVSGWDAQPPLPVALTNPYLAVVGNWLIAAGGITTAGAGTTDCWYSEIVAGNLTTWQPLDSLPVPAAAFSSGWNLAVTDSAVIITCGLYTPGGNSPYTQMLSVGPDGPAQEWQTFQNAPAGVVGDYQVGAYPVDAGAGKWDIVSYQLQQYAAASLVMAPLVSIPLPAAGLTSGGTYHLVFRQLGGDAVANYLLLGQCGPSTATASESWGYAGKWGDSWTRETGYVIAASVADDTASWGPAQHLVEDGGQKVTTLAYSPSSRKLTGILETAEFAGTLNSNPDFTTTVSPWTAAGGTLGVSAVEVQGGYPSSGLLTPDGTSADATATTEDMAVVPGQPVTFAGNLYSPPGYSVAVELAWKDSAGGLISTSSVAVTAVAATWTPFSLTAVAPAGAGLVAASVTESGTPSAADLLYLSHLPVTRADPGRVSSVTEVSWAGNVPSAFTRVS